MKIYVFLLEPDFDIVTPYLAIISGVSLHDLENLSFMVCEAFLKLRKFCQPYSNIGRKSLILFG
jgi:hypothetical protein